MTIGRLTAIGAITKMFLTQTGLSMGMSGLLTATALLELMQTTGIGSSTTTGMIMETGWMAFTATGLITMIYLTKT